MALWSALTAAGGFVTSYGMLMFSRLGVAVGEAVCAPTGTSWIGDMVPVGQRARALAFFMLGVPVGISLSFMVSGPVAQAFGWRRAMMLASGPALLLVPALLLLKEPYRGACRSACRQPDTDPPRGRLLRIPTMWWIIASGAMVNFNLYVIGTFLPAFLTRFHGLTVAEAGIWAGIGHGVSGVAGGVIAGLLWRLGDSPLAATAACSSLAAAALLAAPASFLGILSAGGISGAAAIILIMICYGLLNMYYGNVYSSLQDIVVPSLRGTAMAIYFMAMYLLGASFGPIITGRLSDYFAHKAALAAGSTAITEASRATGLHDAMYVIPLLSLGLAAVLYAGSRTVVRDMERRDA